MFSFWIWNLVVLEFVNKRLLGRGFPVSTQALPMKKE